MDMREAFEEALEKDPYSLATHRAYADWLSEHGEDDAAAAHAAWTPEGAQAAEAWLRGFVKRANGGAEADFWEEAEGYYRLLSYESLLETLEGCVKNGYVERFIFGGIDTPDVVYRESAEMWQKYQELTGRHTGAVAGTVPFSCSC